MARDGKLYINHYLYTVKIERSYHNEWTFSNEKTECTYCINLKLYPFLSENDILDLKKVASVNIMTEKRFPMKIYLKLRIYLVIISLINWNKKKEKIMEETIKL